MSRDIDEIISRVKARLPHVHVHQLQVSHPGVDDDGLWFFSLHNFAQDIQIESPSGQCPFLIEHSGMKSTSGALTGKTIEEVVERVTSFLLILSNTRNG